MKILVTVGSGGFDELIKAADRYLNFSEASVMCQIGKDGYRPNNHPFVEFSSEFSSLWQTADVVVTHGGAATVFELLEAGKKLVVVPNTYRLDSHQLDLAEHLQQQQLALVCRDLTTLKDCVHKAMTQTFKPYERQPFFMADDILHYFGIPTS